MHTVILVITTLSSIATIIAAIIALIKPGMMSRSATITHSERFYAAMYASRALPLGLLTVVAPFTFNGSALQLVFAAASLAQIGDGAQKTRVGYGNCTSYISYYIPCSSVAPCLG